MLFNDKGRNTRHLCSTPEYAWLEENHWATVWVANWTSHFMKHPFSFGRTTKRQAMVNQTSVFVRHCLSNGLNEIHFHEKKNWLYLLSIITFKLPSEKLELWKTSKWPRWPFYQFIEKSNTWIFLMISVLILTTVIFKICIMKCVTFGDLYNSGK